MASTPTNTQISKPIILLSNISNLVLVKLDNTNYIVWKYQVTSILEAYSLLEFNDGSQPCPEKYLRDETESLTLNINAEYTKWMAHDKTLLTMLNATLSPSVLSMVVGQKSPRGVWVTLEKRFTSVNHSNILNLKMDLHGLMKNNDSIDFFLQRVKESRDKLEAVDVHISDEEILHVVLKGLPIEFHSIRSAI
jgi:hypothetical protein